MRFKGTFVLLILCVGFGVFLYFYEIRGGEKRTKAKEGENVVWKVPSDDVQQIDLITLDQHITAIRSGDKQWKITAPRSLDADSDELNRLASSASDISRESVLEENASNLGQFGLDPARTTVALKTKDGNVREIRFGDNNPTGSSTYAALKGKNQVLLVSTSVAGAFNKKLDDLRNHSILSFDQFETQSLDVQSAKGKVQLVKEGDRWWIREKERWAADTSAVSSLLGDLSNGRIKEFFDDDPDDYATLGFGKPLLDLHLTVGKDKAIKHLVVGLEKSKLVKKGQAKAKPEENKATPAEKKAKPEEKPAENKSDELYIARDESRDDLFFVGKEFVDKFLKTPSDLRDKALAAFQRWDIDSIVLTNAKGTVSLAKAQGGGDWLVGDAKKKAKWDAVNELFDALEKPVKGFVDESGAPSKYGFDNPVAYIVLKQGGAVKVDCKFGKDTKEGVYAQVRGEPYVKIADRESLDKMGKGEADFLEPAPPPAPKK
jgi:hypothetical protein